MSTQHATGESVWIDSVELPNRPPLETDVTADVCIVGAGIAGLTTAYQLSLAGQKVVVLDDGTICSGQTQVTTAHLSSVLDDRYFELERIHGEAATRLAAESHGAAIDRIEAIVKQEQIDCDFARVDGFLYGPPAGRESELDREFEAARRTEVLDVARVDRAPWPGFDTGACLRFGRQAQFHPLKYLVQMARAIESRGSQIYCQTHARKMTGGEQARVETATGPVVTAKHLVVATNSPVNDMLAIHTKQAPYITYVIGAAIPPGSLPKALYWDMLDPYHYVRVQPGAANAGGDLLIVGGEDHKTGQAHHTADRHERLIQWSRARFPMLGEIEYRWAGQVMETLDGLAFIGRNPLDKDNVYIATGDSGMGMTHGTIAGVLLCDLILGRENPWTSLYEPTRKPVNALARFAKENLNVAAQYTALLTGGDVSSPAEVLPGQGAIMRQGLTKVALHRAEDGTLHKCSAICPHLGCVVEWNEAERSWDCPCHGSRFRPDGTVVNGPANTNLEPIED